MTPASDHGPDSPSAPPSGPPVIIAAVPAVLAAAYLAFGPQRATFVPALMFILAAAVVATVCFGLVALLETKPAMKRFGAAGLVISLCLLAFRLLFMLN